jgi:hypothetical protein
MSDEFTKNEQQTKFMVSHIGGDLNDNEKQFASQKNIIKNNNNSYIDLINNLNDIERNKYKSTKEFETSQYTKEQIEELYTRNRRINNFPTIIDEKLNISNPIIYPKIYDPHFEYLFKKGINSINTQVSVKYNCINIDSKYRNKEDVMNIEQYLKLVENPLFFKNNSNILQIKITDAHNYFKPNDKITLQGFNFYTENYKNLNFYFNNETNQVVINLNPNYLNPIPYYNVLIEISNVSNNGSNYFKNIPLNVINDIQNIFLITNQSNETKMAFNMPMNFYTDNANFNILTSNCTIKYYFLGNYPINYINSALPKTLYNLNSYFIIDDVNSEYIFVRLTNNISLIKSSTINLNGIWINDDVFQTGGNAIQIGKIQNIEYAYKSSSNYKVFFKKIDNIACIKMISSEIPKTDKLIYKSTNINLNIINSNNYFYWQNALDDDKVIHKIEIPTGNYSPKELTTTMENLISKIPKITNNSNLIPFNNIVIDINENTNITSLKSYNDYLLPNCIINLENPNDTTWILTINHPNHNQTVNDKIIIKNSLNYKKINSNDINKEHSITEILGNNAYKITLKNINLLNFDTSGNGGFAIIITTANSFKIFFDIDNSIGSVLGFKNVGQAGSITPFSNKENNFTINNTQPYIYGTENIEIINNIKNINDTYNTFNFDVGKYLLIKSNNDYLNQCFTPNGLSYFYKIQLNGKTGKIMYNTFVDNPIYFNPPLKYLEDIDLIFLTENGEKYDFFNQDNSLTFQIMSIINTPENTNLSTSIART